MLWKEQCMSSSLYNRQFLTGLRECVHGEILCNKLCVFECRIIRLERAPFAMNV